MPHLPVPLPLRAWWVARLTRAADAAAYALVAARLAAERPTRPPPRSFAAADLPAPAVRATHGASLPAPPPMNPLFQLLTLPTVGALLPYITQVEAVVQSLPDQVARIKAVVAAEQHKTGLAFALDVLSPDGMLDGAIRAAETKAGITSTTPTT